MEGGRAPVAAARVASFAWYIFFRIKIQRWRRESVGRRDTVKIAEQGWRRAREKIRGREREGEKRGGSMIDGYWPIENRAPAVYPHDWISRSKIRPGGKLAFSRLLRFPFCEWLLLDGVTNLFSWHTGYILREKEREREPIFFFFF